MRLARLLLALLVTLVLASSANAAPSASTAAPKSLHGFLFRADEPVRHEFARTPSFAWAPVPGAVSYQLELATSSTFRENGLLYADRTLKSPVASITLTLPWITGSPLLVVCAGARGVQERRDVVEQALRLQHAPDRGAASARELSRPAALDAGRRRDRVRRVADRHPEDGSHLRQRHGRARVLHLPPGEPVDVEGALAHPHRALRPVAGRPGARERPARELVRRLEPRLRVGQPALRRRRAEGSRDRLGRRLEGPVVGPRAPVDARVRVRRQPGTRRARHRAVPHLRLHRP